MVEIRHLLKRLMRERRSCLFYAYAATQGTGCAQANIRVFTNWGSLPEAWRRLIVPAPWLDPKFYRLGRGLARLLCCSEDGRTLDAYGWIQDWKPFRRQFGALATEGTMLGPYRTIPHARGRGLYQRLLLHSLSVCSLDKPVLIYTTPDNVASRRGIEKAGFRFLGTWVIERRWGCWRLQGRDPSAPVPAGDLGSQGGPRGLR